MDDMQLFYRLKEYILGKYREAYPYYTGAIANFGNREIAQLIDLIEKDCHERVSEKWVYTHLKPQRNEKLPRRDMLDIFCRWTGYANWEEFVFREREQPQPIQHKALLIQKASGKKIVAYGIVLLLVLGGVFMAAAFANRSHEVIICLKDKYTQKAVEAGKANLYELKGGRKIKLPQQGNCFKLADNNATVITESAYYKADTLIITGTMAETPVELELQPDDYAMMLRAYMNGNVADWNKRRSQLAEIISDEAVVQEIMFDEIGVEFLNKQEFIDKVTTPGTMAKNMEVVEIKYEGGKIISLKFMHKGT